MKLFFVLAVAILLIQALCGHSFVSNAANSPLRIKIDEENRAVAVDKRHRPRIRIKCGHECTRRCKESSRKNVCHRACKTCCEKCKCVPPGIYGNKNTCPCYANLRTHRNQPKCP